MSSPKSDTNSQEPGKDEYTVGWICALQEEYDAACRMLDERFDDPEGDFANDNNTYQFGRIKKHYVVIGCLPTGKYGTNSATAVAKDMVRSFPKIRFALMVGIGAGAPTAKHDIRLGDIVVGADNNVHGGIIQLDAVKRSRAEDGSVQTKLWRHLNDPPNVLLGALPKIRENYNDPEQKDKVGEHMKRMNLEYRPEFSRPSEDRLYRDDYHHPEGERDCSKCSLNKLEKRGERRLINRAVKVHYGTIGSSDSLMKVVEERIKYAEDPDLKILCFEMEAAGLMNTISCLVIRGICDYADSHKNDDWHNYAALAAAAYARELLVVLRAETVAKQPSWGTKVYEKVHKLEVKLDEDQRHRRKDEILRQIADDSEKNYHDDAYASYLGKKHDGTGNWFITHLDFQTWVDGQVPTLFCQGPPGAGKSVIASIAINYLQAERAAKCIYLYCNRRMRAGEGQTERTLLSVLLRQLCETANLPEHIENRPRDRPLSLEEILQAFSDVARSYGRIFLIIDALDEFSLEVRESLLKNITNIQDKVEVSFMATSRGKIPSIEEKFKTCPTIEIKAEREDMKKFIKSRLDEIKHLQKDCSLQDYIAQKVAQMAGPLQVPKMPLSPNVANFSSRFLLARLYFERLKTTDTVFDVENWLDRLPSGPDGLTKLYDESLQKIDQLGEAQRDRTYCLLSWVFHSRESLTPSALEHALSLREGDTQLNTKNVPNAHQIIFRCEGLIVVNDRRGVVEFVHATVQQYFNDNQGKFGNTDTVPRQIALRCVTYLAFDEFEGGPCSELQERLLKMPLYKYAACNWGHHARTASCHTEIDEIIQGFMENQSKISAAAQAMELGRSIRSITALHLASHFGLGELVEMLLSKGHSPIAPDTSGRTPLLLAARSGSRKAVGALLEKGACIIAEHDEGYSAVHAAAHRGDKEILRLLLKCTNTIETKNIIDISTTKGQTALHIAAEQNHRDVVEFLLDKGASIIATTLYNETPLHFAVGGRREDIVRLLIDRSGDMDHSYYFKERNEPSGSILGYNCGSTRWYGRSSYVSEAYHSFHYSGPTLLHHASMLGDQKIVNILIEKGANVNAIGLDDMTPLLVAVSAGKKEIAELLLRHNVNVNATRHYGKTPLHMASYHGYYDITRLLIEKGANTRAKDQFGITPLYEAVRGVAAALTTEKRSGAIKAKQVKHDPEKIMMEHAKVIKLLIEGGADIDAEFNGKMALHTAIEEGYGMLAKTLLALGASIKMSSGITAFDLAVKSKQDDIAGIVLEHIARTETPIQTGGFVALQVYVAAVEGRKDQVNLLLNSSAKSSIQDKLVQSALVRSAYKGYGDIVQLFIDAGVDIRAKDYNGRTALQMAVQEGNLALVRRLVALGAEIDRFSSGTKLLVPAVEGGHHDVAEFLLENGATTQGEIYCNGLGGGDSIKYDGGTALIRASISGRLSLIQLLLRYGADVNYQTNRSKVTALSVAASNRHLDAVKVLLEAGADVDAPMRDTSYVVDERSLSVLRITALQWAAWQGNAEMVELLVKKGADLHLSNPIGWTALHFAAARGYHTVVSILIKGGASSSMADKFGRTALCLVAERGYEKVARLLLDEGNADPDTGRIGHGWTALQQAAEKGHKEIVSLLLRSGASVREKDSDGRTPLHLAAGAGPATVEILLQSNEIEVGAEDKKGRTPLHHAAHGGFKEVAELLLKHGADREARDHQGRTPVKIAMEARHERLIPLLTTTPLQHTDKLENSYKEPPMSSLSESSDSLTPTRPVYIRRELSID